MQTNKLVNNNNSGVCFFPFFPPHFFSSHCSMSHVMDSNYSNHNQSLLLCPYFTELSVTVHIRPSDRQSYNNIPQELEKGTPDVLPTAVEMPRAYHIVLILVTVYSHTVGCCEAPPRNKQTDLMTHKSMSL